MNIEELDLSVRTFNALKKEGVNTVEELQEHWDDLYYTLNSHAVNEVEDKFEVDDTPGEDRKLVKLFKPIETTDISELPKEEPQLTTFDYSTLDTDTATELEVVASKIHNIKQKYIFDVAKEVAYANSLLANHYNGKFGAWCESIGMSRDTGDNLVRVAELFGNCTESEIVNLSKLKPTFLYNISRPTAPPELVEQVLNGDITTNAEYQKLKNELDEAHKREQEYIIRGQELNRQLGDLSNARNKAQQQAYKLERQVKALESRPIDVAVQEVPQSEEHFNEVIREIEHKYILQADEADKELAEMRNERNELREKLEKQLARSKPDDDTAQLRAELERLKNPNVKLWGLRLTAEEMTELISISEQLGSNVKQAVSKAQIIKI